MAVLHVIECEKLGPLVCKCLATFVATLPIVVSGEHKKGTFPYSKNSWYASSRVVVAPLEEPKLTPVCSLISFLGRASAASKASNVLLSKRLYFELFFIKSFSDFSLLMLNGAHQSLLSYLAF